jgi:hypothetical protein
MLRVVTTMTGLAGAPYYSTQYFGGDTSGEAIAAADAVAAFWTSLVGFITNGLTIQVGPEVDNLNAATGLVEDTFPSGSPAAILTGGNAPLPKATQGLLRLRTNDFVAGRRIQGRIFIPALANDAQVGGVPSNLMITSLQAAGEDLLTDGAPAGGFVVWHRPNSETSTVGEPALVTSVSVWNQFAVLRSRRD